MSESAGPLSVSPSVWMTPQAPDLDLPRLPAGQRVDLAVVGGGLLGLSAALAAARRGLSVAVLEAGRIAGRAAGLSGGQVIPGLKQDPETLRQRLGPVAGERLVRFSAGTAAAVFDLVARETLDVPVTRGGWIEAAHTEAALARASDRARQWQAEGADVALLGPADVALLTGAGGYLGGFLDRRAGTVDPRRLTLALAGAALRAGAAVHEASAVTRITAREGRFALETAHGVSLSARRVLVATNACSAGLVPGLAETLLPLSSFQIATDPLPPALDETVLPQGQAVSDSRRILVYYRRTPDGRLMLGGRGRHRPRRPADWRHLERALHRLYPQLQNLPISHRWHGRVAMTLDGLPHLHEPVPGLVAFVGCQGRGIGLMVAMGAVLADYAADGDPQVLPFPVTPIRPMRFPALRHLGTAAAIAWYRFLDRREA